jgi:hypothetical protein
MTERDIKELLGHMVIQMRIAEMAMEQKDAEIKRLQEQLAATPQPRRSKP